MRLMYCKRPRRRCVETKDVLRGMLEFGLYIIKINQCDLIKRYHVTITLSLMLLISLLLDAWWGTWLDRY